MRRWYQSPTKAQSYTSLQQNTCAQALQVTGLTARPEGLQHHWPVRTPAQNNSGFQDTGDLGEKTHGDRPAEGCVEHTADKGHPGSSPERRQASHPSGGSSLLPHSTGTEAPTSNKSLLPLSCEVPPALHVCHRETGGNQPVLTMGSGQASRPLPGQN